MNIITLNSFKNELEKISKNDNNVTYLRLLRASGLPRNKLIINRVPLERDVLMSISPLFSTSKKVKRLSTQLLKSLKDKNNKNPTLTLKRSIKHIRNLMLDNKTRELKSFTLKAMKKNKDISSSRLLNAIHNNKTKRAMAPDVFAHELGHVIREKKMRPITDVASSALYNHYSGETSFAGTVGAWVPNKKIAKRIAIGATLANVPWAFHETEANIEGVKLLNTVGGKRGAMKGLGSIPHDLAIAAAPLISYGIRSHRDKLIDKTLKGKAIKAMKFLKGIRK